MSESILIDAENNQKISAIYKGYGENFVRDEDGDGKSLIIMAHDFPGHKSGNNDLYADLEFIFTKKGHHTLRFDFRGCGGSDGKQEDFTLERACEDFQSVRAWAKNAGYKNFAYIGEGLGATIAFMNVEKDVNVILVLWPILDTHHFGQTAFNAKGASLKDGYIELNGHKISTHLIDELEKIDLYYALKEASMPTMIFHGVEDKKIPIEQLDIIRKNLKSRRIEITSFQDGGEGLQKLNHRKAIFYQAQQFIEKYA